jgi:polyisoprenyl-teichoic acid--peptidoglycan teichoic acid transferase
MRRINQSRVERVRKKRIKKWLFRAAFLSLALIVLSGSYLFYRTWDAAAETHKPMDRKKSDLREKEVTIEDPFTILILGTDVAKENQNWRADVIIVAAVNPKTKSVKMVSIPRDSYVEIANTGGHRDKINAAPYWGTQKGVDPVTNTAETIEQLLNVPIDHYAKVNFRGFIDIVDALGGVDVNVKFDFWEKKMGSQERYYFKKGPAHLNGDQALSYVRMRKRDPKGDLGRNERQREVLVNLMDQAVSLKGLTKINEILDILGQNISTSLKVREMIAMQDLYRKISKENIDSIELKGTNTRIQIGAYQPWVFQVSEAERQRVSKILREHLELDPPSSEGELTDSNPSSGTTQGNEGGQSQY